ncbi:ADAMTS-like protein 5 isoform X2 [Periophthalmus magnuspinnatus]|uniref:ADAMTS-like protein 5 isoform X2 n=1 Tax=Periophthalmus magnuspinnatus TaxID=409849 RepID=UPI002436B8AC|nr:ADAMTS-like protein 5 isoform X2 [Periophthalmus magnuspinnatus]
MRSQNTTLRETGTTHCDPGTSPRAHRWNHECSAEVASARPQSGSDQSRSSSGSWSQLNEWGPWGVWSVCSRTCGGGASVRVRTCVTRNPVGRPCSGDPRQYKICNIKSCPAGAVDFRELQCRAFNHRPLVSGSSFTWMPFHSGSSPCELSCLAEGHMFYLNFGKALDGTSCGSEPGSVCVNGHCLKAGCDQILGSGLTEDACLICGGLNRTCLHHQEMYRPTVLGYSEVAMIPAGATHIRVTDNSRNYLVLQNGRSEFIINGHWTISRPGEYPAAGTKLQYRRSSDQWESLELSGPTREDLHLLVLSTESGPGISFEYWLPPDQYFLLHGPKSPLHQAPHSASVTMATPASVSTETTKAITAIRPQRRVNRVKPPRQTSSLWLNTQTEPELNQHVPPPGPSQRRCGACPAIRGRRERQRQFCSKDFVVRAWVRSVLFLGSESRYEIEILESYRNRFPLLHREFLWAPDQCCPLLERGKQYVLMLRRHVNHENTLNRLLLEPRDYSVPYRPREDRHMRELQASCGNRGDRL